MNQLRCCGVVLVVLLVPAARASDVAGERPQFQFVAEGASALLTIPPQSTFAYSQVTLGPTVSARSMLSSASMRIDKAHQDREVSCFTGLVKKSRSEVLELILATANPVEMAQWLSEELIVNPEQNGATAISFPAAKLIQSSPYFSQSQLRNAGSPAKSQRYSYLLKTEDARYLALDCADRLTHDGQPILGEETHAMSGADFVELLHATHTKLELVD